MQKFNWDLEVYSCLSTVIKIRALLVLLSSMCAMLLLYKEKFIVDVSSEAMLLILETSLDIMMKLYLF